MKTYHLEKDTVDGYIRDWLSLRAPQALRKSGARNVVLCYVGASGRAFMERILEILGGMLSSLPSGSAQPTEPKKGMLTRAEAELILDAAIIRAVYDRNNNSAQFYHYDPESSEGKPEGHDEEISAEQLRVEVSGRHVFLLDSPVHSGGSMCLIYDCLAYAEPVAVTSYALVVKESAKFIPNYFSLLIGREDRALFMLEKIPNLRVFPIGTLRLLDEKDMTRPPVRSGVRSMDRVTWSDMVYSMEMNPLRSTYLFATGLNPCAYITVELADNHVLFVDAVATDGTEKVGGQLMRWAESYARSHNCKRIRLWGIETARGFYQKLEYREVCAKPPMVLRELDGHEETYYLFEKDVLHHRFDPGLFISHLK